MPSGPPRTSSSAATTCQDHDDVTTPDSDHQPGALPRVISATQMSNSFLGALIEVCWVTRDHRRTMEGLVKLGLGPWRVYTFDSTTVTQRTYAGREADFGIKVCFADVGDIALEIMQPLWGPSIFQEFLDRRGEGIHHVAFDAEGRPWPERLATFEQRGFPLAQSGRFMDANAFAFFDTEATTGTTFETYDIPHGFEWPEPEEWFPGPPPEGERPPVRTQGE
jgi:methylmalonyl-CoA/ethylmalonyl-CoA epimerase